MTTLAVSFLIYSVGIAVLGLVSTRFSRGTEADFLLADRGLGAWVGALSASASAESGFVTLGLVGMAFEPPHPGDWKYDVMAPLPAPSQSNHAKRKPIRRHLPEHHRLELGRAEAQLKLPLSDYWTRFEEVAVRELLAFEEEGATDRDEIGQLS